MDSFTIAILSIILIGVVITAAILLLYRYVPAFRNKKKQDDKSVDSVEAAKEDIKTYVRDDNYFTMEAEATLKTRLKKIEDKEESTQIQLKDEYIQFLVIQEKFEEIDRAFLRNKTELF